MNQLASSLLERLAIASNCYFLIQLLLSWKITAYIMLVSSFWTSINEMTAMNLQCNTYAQQKPQEEKIRFMTTLKYQSWHQDH